MSYAEVRDVPLYTKLLTSPEINTGVLNEIDRRSDLGLVLMGWPGSLDMAHLATNVVNDVLIEAKTNVAVFRDHSLIKARHILVPVGGGPHSRLAIQLAYEIAEAEQSRITFLHIFSSKLEDEDTQDELLQLREIVEEELDLVPERSRIKIMKSSDVMQGILDETQREKYDLMVLGASEEWTSREYLFGPVDDQLAEKAPCSVLMVRRYEPVAINWLRKQIKRIGPE
jgi:nucleotide-binding universal stress UspA family protein